MDAISTLFDRMDAWRHLPSYQLERRADLFFSLYLAEALEAKLGFSVNPRLIPEFPVRIGTTDLARPTDASKKIDYVAFSSAADTVVFTELKTDGRSRNETQDNYLKAAQRVGFVALLEGVLSIFRVTQAKAKYFCLLDQLAQLGLLELPLEMSDIMKKKNLRGITEASRSIRVTCGQPKCLVVYVQPTGSGNGVISFDDFRTVVSRYNDPVSMRFAKSLQDWAATKAGTA